ncbi:peptidase inhibitor family I36 protein [Streptomyces sp. CA-132043]|uniref:peptidase inhibitor family I36 protein n=1 Tax=Streptomyces sp. CA-132043 TaxID=3240048 RepID=UPI003D8F7987
MRVRRFCATFGALAIASVSIIAGPAGAASAEQSERCPEGYVCFWTEGNFTGNMTVYENPAHHNCTVVEGISAGSVYNNDDQAWDFYRDASCGSYLYTLAPGEQNTTVRVHSWQ